MLTAMRTVLAALALSLPHSQAPTTSITVNAPDGVVAILLGDNVLEPGEAYVLDIDEDIVVELRVLYKEGAETRLAKVRVQLHAGQSTEVDLRIERHRRDPLREA
jgi:hypothetical protein